MMESYQSVEEANLPWHLSMPHEHAWCYLRGLSFGEHLGLGHWRCADFAGEHQYLSRDQSDPGNFGNGRWVEIE